MRVCTSNPGMVRYHVCVCVCVYVSSRQPNVANVAVRKQFQRLMEFIGEGKLHSVSCAEGQGGAGLGNLESGT